MSYDYKRAKRVEEALTAELGLFLAPPKRLAELRREVRRFLVMLDAALEPTPETSRKPQDEGKGQILGRRTRW